MDVNNYQGGGGLDFTSVYNGITQGLYKNQARIDAEAKLNRTRQAEAQKTIQTSFAKVNPTGLQQVDMNDYKRLYGELKDKYSDVVQSKFDPEKTMEFERKKGELLNLVSLSKERGSRAFTATQGLQNNIEKYKDGEAKSYLDKWNNTPTLQLTDINPDFTPYRIMHDSSKFDSDLEKSIKTIMDSGKVESIFDSKTTRIGGRNFAIDTIEKREIAKEAGLNIISQLYEGNSNAKRTIDELYGGNLELAYEGYKDKFSSVKSRRDIKADPVVNVTNINNGLTNESDNIQDALVTYNGGKSNVQLKDRMLWTENNVTLMSSQKVVDANTGEPTELKDYTKGETVALVRVPIGDVTVKGQLKKNVLLTPNVAKDSNYKTKALVKTKDPEDGTESYVYVDVADVKKSTLTKQKTAKLNEWVEKVEKPNSNTSPKVSTSQNKSVPSKAKVSDNTLNLFKIKK